MDPSKITIFITPYNYHQNKDTIDLYTLYNRIGQLTDKDGIVTNYITIDITAANLSDLLTKLGTDLTIDMYLTHELKSSDFWPFCFLIDIFKYTIDASQLTQTILQVYENDDDFKCCPAATEARVYAALIDDAFAVKDKNVWKSITMPIDTDIRTYICVVDSIFKAATNDSLIDAAVKYLNIIDNNFDEGKDELYDENYESLEKCITYSINNNCHKMRKLFIKSSLFKHTEVNLHHVIRSILDEKFDVVDELLELIDKDMLYLETDHFEHFWRSISYNSTLYLFDLIVDDRITIRTTHISKIIQKCCFVGNDLLLSFLLTYYPLSVDQSLQKHIKSVCTPNYYAQIELEKLVKTNEELMSELDTMV